LKKKHKILFIQPISSFSGSLKSSEEYIKNLYRRYSFIFLTQNGFSSKILKKYGKVFTSIGISKFDNTENSRYIGLRWLLLVREVIYLPLVLFSLIVIKFKIKKIDLIHLNEITGLPTAIIAKLLFKKSLIVHVRSSNYRNKKNLISNLHFFLLNKFADKILAIDNDILKTVYIKKKSIILRNILDFKKQKFNKKNRNNKLIKIGYIGSYLKYKGLENLITAIQHLVHRGFHLELVVAGSIIKRNFLLKILFRYLNLDNNINENLLRRKFINNLGFISDVKKFYNNIDILCFPSSLNATGRQIFEAGFFSKPVILCIKKKNCDGLIEKYNGISYRNFSSINQLKNKILYFYYNRNLIKVMGKNGRKIAVKRNTKKNNVKILDTIYIEQLR
jgi:glycosyltransferase involved in cell wall biosynthesis